MKTIYILRHSKPNKTKPQEENKNINLSEEGILLAKQYLTKNIFKDIKNIYCSDYKRSYQTGMLADKNIIIDKRLGERIAGIPQKNITPLEYFYRQVQDENYAFNQGETRKQIEHRMYNALIDILSQNDKAIIITHGTSLTFLLMKLCQIEFPNHQTKIRTIKFNNKIIFNDEFKYLETFKLIFENNKLINIESVGNYENI